QLTPQERIYVVGKHADFSLQQKTGSLFGVPSLFDYESLPTRRFAEFYTMLRTGQHMRSLVDFYYPIAGLLPQTTRHRLLVLADPWFPGWQATVGGTPVPILRADYVFRLVEVPAGRSTVEFRYVPDALLLGALISAVTAGAIVLALVRLPRRKQLKDGAEDGYTGSPRVPSRSTRWQHGGS